MVHKKPLSGENLRGLERTERERVAEKSRKGTDVPNTYVRRRINLSTVKWDDNKKFLPFRVAVRIN